MKHLNNRVEDQLNLNLFFLRISPPIIYINKTSPTPMFSLKRIWHDLLAHQLPEDDKKKNLKNGMKAGGQTQGSGDVVCSDEALNM